MKKIIEYRYIWIYSFIFVCLLLLNRTTLYTSDDYTYHFFYQGYMPTENLKEIHNIFDLIQSQYNHYQLWNGRFVAHTLVQIFMQFNKLFFDISNSLVFCLLVHFLYRFTFAKKEKKGYFPMIIFIYLWFFLPEIGKSVLWVSGSGNYLWSSILYLGMLYIFLFWDTLSPSWRYLSPLIAFLAGATNENSAPTVLLVCGIEWIWKLYKTKKLDVLQFFSLVVGGIGFLLIITSPGSLARGQMDRSLGKILSNVESLFKMSTEFYAPVYWLMILLFILVLCFGLLSKVEWKLFLFYIIAHCASIYSLALSPETPLRTFFGASLFLGLTLFLLMKKAFTLIPDYFVTYLALFGMIIFLYHYQLIYQDNHHTYLQVVKQYDMIRKADNQTIVEVPMYQQRNNLYNAYNGTANLTEDENSWFNVWMARYFKKKGIIGIPPQ